MELKRVMEKKQTCVSSSLAIRKTSQIISKVKPKIRIIHIFAPEIIKTDAANFRELVQSLTGKPTDSNCSKKEPRVLSSNKQMELAMITGFHSEEDIWTSSNAGGGFLTGFNEFDGFMQEINQFSSWQGSQATDMPMEIPNLLN
ncbi:VQ motif-containing protein motif-containing protein 25 [Forsythia ovata]|uniref:VQ motif-containing protein motif-containing protein 25 n=1 Tax=Forsythia ovata TaxID=205694 RepID=A0ABD1SP97_9LAMI